MRKVKSKVTSEGMPKYSLDLAFSSTIPIGYDPKDDASMLALGFGWAKNDNEGDPWEKQGQKAESVQVGALVYFVVYDGQTTQDPNGTIPAIIEFELDFSSVTAPIQGNSVSFSTPFVDGAGNPVSNPITSTGGPFPFSDTLQGSTGCNIVGYPCQPLAANTYYVNRDIARDTIYQCTVKFTVHCLDGTFKTFKVDPQMIVGGGG